MSKKLLTEDWLAVWIGFVVIGIACLAVLTGWFDFSAMKFSTWSVGEQLSEKAAAKAVPLLQQLGAWVFWRKTLVTVLVLGALFALGVKLRGEKLRKFIPAFVVLYVLAFAVRLISAVRPDGSQTDVMREGLFMPIGSDAMNLPLMRIYQNKR